MQLLIVGFLCLITLYIYMPWGMVRLIKWTMDRTHFQGGAPGMAQPAMTPAG